MGGCLERDSPARPGDPAAAAATSNARHLPGLDLLRAVAIGAAACTIFRDRTGLLADSIGWPILSAGFGALVFAAADRRSAIGRLNLPGASWLAAISYSLLPGPAVFAIYAAAASAPGASLHHLAERPFLRRRDRRYRRLAC